MLYMTHFGTFHSVSKVMLISTVHTDSYHADGDSSDCILQTRGLRPGVGNLFMLEGRINLAVIK
jgi:hypothetical protein